jgi:hypothetical protein
VGAVYNGVTVYVRDLTMDREGRRLAYIIPLKAGKAGWVSGHISIASDGAAG